MSTDLRTVLWKEWRSLVNGRARRQLLLTGGMLAIWGVLFPIQMGADWVSDPVPMGILGVVLPMVVVGIIIPDAIAGERERHTLSTLLASRLPDRAILYGKLGLAVVVGWLTAPALLAVALVVVNATAGSGDFLLYEPAMLAAVLLAGLLVAILTGGIGIFVSLRAGTAQEAQQMTLMGLMLPLMVIGMGLTTVLFANRELGRSVIDWAGSADARLLAAGVLVALGVVDAILVWAADRRFRRARLITR
jgi:ABC-2 type transport system permease protein